MAHMECIELVERITDSLEEALDPAELAPFLDHLQACPGCDAYLTEALFSLKVLSNLPVQPLSPELESALLADHHAWAEENAA